MSSPEPSCICDTVVVLYFLLVEEEVLLRDLIGDPIRVPLTVYDPDERSLPEDALRHSELLSEMRQAVRHYETAVRIGGADPELLDRVARIDEMFDEGALEPVDLEESEIFLAARLQSRDEVAEFGLRFPLGPGEASCVAIAWERHWTIATDDDAALSVLDHLHAGRTYPYERIRKLLIRAADEKRITRKKANEVHQAMRDLGFWDTGIPFP